VLQYRVGGVSPNVFRRNRFLAANKSPSLGRNHGLNLVDDLDDPVKRLIIYQATGYAAREDGWMAF